MLGIVDLFKELERLRYTLDFNAYYTFEEGLTSYHFQPSFQFQGDTYEVQYHENTRYLVCFKHTTETGYQFNVEELEEFIRILQDVKTLGIFEAPFGSLILVPDMSFEEYIEKVEQWKQRI